MSAVREHRAAKAPINAMDVIEWTTGDADAVLLNRGRVVHRLELPAAEARRLGEWLETRLLERGRVRLGEVLEQHAACTDAAAADEERG